MALTTLEKVKEFIGLKQPQTEADALLTRMIDAASAFIENWLERKVLRHSVVEYRDGNGKSELVLKEPDIRLISKVLVNGRAIPESSDFHGYGYRWADWWLILQGDCFTHGRKNIQIEYEAGFDVVPSDIEQAVIDLVTLRFKEKDRIGIQSKTLANETISFFIGELTPSARATLQQYKRVVPI